MELQGEEGYPRAGSVDFFNNLVNPATDTLLVRSVFANPKKASGRELKPGMFVRVKLPIKVLLAQEEGPKPALSAAVGEANGEVAVIDSDPAFRRNLPLVGKEVLAFVRKLSGEGR